MAGYKSPPQDSGREHPRFETLVADAVGDVIEFWGFKQNHGRVWAVLYVHDRAMTARQLRERLDLSKGAVSMITGELLDWEVLEIVERDGERARKFRARSDFLAMIRGVLKRREQPLVERVVDDLGDARRLAELGDDVGDETVERLRRLEKLAEFMRRALEVFIDRALFDVTDAEEVL